MKIILILLTAFTLYADIKQDVFNLYEEKKYITACNLGYKHVYKYTSDEEFVSLYAFSCLNADYIDRLAVPIGLLKFTPQARANSAYFSVILMQKKLLYRALVDNYDLSPFRLPSTQHILSKIFDFYAKIKKNSQKNSYTFYDEINKQKSYKLLLVRNSRLSKVIIEEYIDNRLLSRHVYW